MGFHFWFSKYKLKEESEEEYLKERGREFQITGLMESCIEKISPQGFSCRSLEHGRSEYPRLSKESETEKESKDDATRYGLMEEIH